jgi:hypothetical protein
MIPAGRLLPPIAIGAATLGAVAVAWMAHGGAIFSPGGLNASVRAAAPRGGVRTHAELSHNCAACHVSPWSSESMADHCQDCHAEIRRQIAAHMPLHGKLTDSQNCRACHGEHNGPAGALTSFTNFDHDCTAFKLTGKHVGLACVKCHVNNVFQGTARSCAGCHADPPIHRGRFGLDCAKCHSTATWKGAFVQHVFPLNHGGGPKHAAKDCAVCHTTPGDYKSYTCYGCHRHEPTKTAEKHVKKGIAEFRDCFACHPTGRKRKDDPPKHPMLPGPTVPAAVATHQFPAVDERVRARLAPEFRRPLIAG